VQALANKIKYDKVVCKIKIVWGILKMYLLQDQT